MSEKDEERKGGPRPLGQLLAPLVRPLAKQRPAAEAGLLADWPSIVGPAFARLAWPIRLRFDRPAERREGVLELGCEGWAALELQHLAPQVIARVNAYLGFPAVARLRIRQKGRPGDRRRAGAS